MSSFEETIARMKGLYTYGKELNESKDLNSHTLEYHAIAADGKSYGIIKECNKYYIKSAPKDKEMIAEAYDYLGGFCNKGSYEYKSYANALKNFELKMASINEACEANISIATLDPFKKEEFLVEGTEKMKDEIARCRQIMYNTAMIMNESTEIGASRKKDGTVMFDGENPEAENGKKGDEGLVKTNAEPEYKGSNTNGVDKKVVPFDNNPTNSKDQLKEDQVCEKCGKKECCCDNCNEECEIGDNPMLPNTENWGTEGIGKGRDPQDIGWEIDGQERVDEEENDWASEGLPSSAGIGEADTDHNNEPFNVSINEEENLDAEEQDDDETIESEDDETFDLNNDDFDTETEDISTETDFDDGLEDEFSDEEETIEPDDEFDNQEEPSDEEDDEDSDLRSEIESLKAEIESLKAQLNLDDEEPVDDNDFDENETEVDIDFDNNDFNDDSVDDEIEYDEEEIDECGFNEKLMESKQNKMDTIIESVVKRILKEDELHVFGKHPGYRKKPMELPTTGEDKNQWGEDWNDESVYSEEPFGSKIGNGDPFKELVNSVTKDVMYQLKKGIPIEGENKKKEN